MLIFGEKTDKEIELEQKLEIAEEALKGGEE